MNHNRFTGRLFPPQIGRRGYIFAGGVKLFRWVKERRSIQFFDGDNRRALRRGTPLVEVAVRDLYDLLKAEPQIFYDSEEGVGACEPETDVV